MACSTVLTMLVIISVLLFPVPVSNTWNHPAMFSDTGRLDLEPVWQRNMKPLSVFETSSRAVLRRSRNDQLWPGPNDDQFRIPAGRWQCPHGRSQDWRSRLRWMQDKQQMDQSMSGAKI